MSQEQGTKYVVGRLMSKEELDKNLRAIAERDKKMMEQLNADPLEQIKWMKEHGKIVDDKSDR